MSSGTRENGKYNMANITKTDNGLRITDADWSDLRETTIGAHETPALFHSVADIADEGEDHEEFETDTGVAISAYSSPLALWEMKSGLYRPSGSGKRGLWSRIKWGVIESACEDQEIETRRAAGVYLHPELDCMSSRIDREASDDGGETWVPVTSYNVAGTMTDTWRNAVGEWVVPEYVEVEAHHHMAVTGAMKCFVVALFGGVSTRFFTVDRDEELITDIVETIQDFWQRVEDGIRPEDAGVRDAKVMSRLNSKVNPQTEVKDMRGDAEFLALIEKKDSLSKKANGIKKEIDEIKAQIASRMEGIGSAVISDTKQYVWVTVQDKEQPATIKKGYTYLGARKISEKSAGAKLLDLISS
jgi:predicted phage-related endonuclease